MRRFDCEFKEIFEAAIPHVSHDRRVVIDNALSLQRGVDSLREPQGFLRKLPLSIVLSP
jgi:hypothetical protein